MALAIITDNPATRVASRRMATVWGGELGEGDLEI